MGQGSAPGGRDDPNNLEPVERLLKKGVDLIGGAAGASVGHLVGGMTGAVIGGAAGPIITELLRVAGDFALRQLSQREEVRVGAVIHLARRRIVDNQSRGLPVRQDGFFEDRLDERSSATEVSEGTLRAAQQEYQEKKIPFYGNLLGNVPFHPEINPAQAVALLKLGERLSYRQFCLIALLEQRHRYSLTDASYTYDSETESRTLSIIQEAAELNSLGLVKMGNTMAGWTVFAPLQDAVAPVGKQLYRLLNLDEINKGDVEAVAAALRSPEAGPQG